MAEKRNKGRPKAESQGSSLKTFYVILALVAVVGIGAVGYSLGSSAISSAATEPVDLGEVDDRELVALATPIEVGNPDAEVSIIEFADYQCPSCGVFHNQFKPLVDLNFIEPGKAKFVFYDFPLIRIHPNAFLAARAARCADDQGGFESYQDILFERQSSWSGQSSPLGSFVSYAESIGLDEGDFETCLKSDRFADVVSANAQLAQRLGVNGTPTIMVSRGQGMAQRLGSFDYETIRRAVEAALEQ